MQKTESGFGLIAVIAVLAILGAGAAVLIGGQSVEKEAMDVTSPVADMLESAEGAKEMMEKDAAAKEEAMKEVDMMADTVKTSENKAKMEVESDDMMKKEAEMMDDTMSDDEMMDDAATSGLAPSATVAGTFTDYSADKLALAADGDVVLFFHASWCPSCRALEGDIQANLSAIPADTHLLKVDYDSATDLRQKYGVTRQHTLVVVDAAGNKIKTITSPTNTLAQVVAAI